MFGDFIYLHISIYMCIDSSIQRERHKHIHSYTSTEYICAFCEWVSGKRRRRPHGGELETQKSTPGSWSLTGWGTKSSTLATETAIFRSLMMAREREGKKEKEGL